MKSNFIHLLPKHFDDTEKILVENGSLFASLFRFPSGVCAIRFKSALGELVMLPYQGQQIWQAQMGGRNLTMKSMFDQPYPTCKFLATFGGFLVHCGATAIGSPGPGDTHPLHGELPNAPYQSAQIVLGQDEKGEYIGLTGVFHHTIAFNCNYIAQPLVKLYSNSTVFHISMTITNLKQTLMPLMYLAHINFRPVDHGQQVYSAPCDPEHMRVRTTIPPFMEAHPGYREFIEELKIHPEKHLVLRSGLAFDPEVVLYIKFLADESGWAHALQVHPDGSADVVRHRPNQLNHGVRWICRTPDQDALGFEPSTAEVEGFITENKKGNVRRLAGGEVFHCDIEAGTLCASETQTEEELIRKTLSNQ